MSTTETVSVPRLRAKYDDEIRAALKEQLGLGNIMQVPRLDKIVINMGVGAAVGQPSLLEGAVKDLTRIAGQKPIITRARKSIANFKLREENPIGTKVTLRGARMWEFLDRLISLAIPRVRLPHDGHRSATLATGIGMSLSMMPPCIVALVAFWCFLTTLTPSTITLLAVGSTRVTLPVLPRSLPVSTLTLSPFLILRPAMVTAPPGRATRSS